MRPLVQRLGMLVAPVLAVLVAAGATARAERKLIIPRSESALDWGTRKEVEAVVLDLAQHVDRGASQTDLPFPDLAAATGCSGGVAKCKNAVLEAIDVDELVLITIAAASAGHAKVTVKRASKGGVAEAHVVIPTDAPEAPLRAGLASLFGLSAREAAAPSRGKSSAARGTAGTKPATTVSPEKARAMAALDRSRPADADTADDPPAADAPATDQAMARSTPAPDREPPPAEPPPAPAAAPEETPPPGPAAEVTAAPDNVVVDNPTPRRYRKLYVGGVIGGGALAVIGVVLWAQAASVESDLRDAPNRTSADVQHLLDLEAKGDSYATWGNVTFVGGLAIAGVSGFLLWRDIRRERSARIAPVAFDHGAGVALTFGAGR